MANRNCALLVRMTPEEKSAIQSRMAEMGIRNMSAYFRKMAIDGYCIHLDLSDVKELVRLLRICSNNLNQYAKVANTYGTVYQEDMISLQIKMDELWTEAKKIMSALAKLE